MCLDAKSLPHVVHGFFGSSGIVAIAGGILVVLFVIPDKEQRVLKVK
jgi:hypothetical protein